LGLNQSRLVPRKRYSLDIVNIVPRLGVWMSRRCSVSLEGSTQSVLHCS